MARIGTRPARLAGLMGCLSLIGLLAAAGAKGEGPAKPPAPPPPPVKAGPAKGKELTDKLAQPIRLDKPIANGKLKEVLQLLEDRYNISILIDFGPTDMDGAGMVGEQDDVGGHEVNLPKLTGVRLSRVLQMLADQVQGAYLVRKDYIEFTSKQRWALEVYGVDISEGGTLGGVGPGTGFGLGLGSITAAVRKQFPAVSTHLPRRPIDKLLEDLADLTDINVILDSRLTEKGLPNASLNVLNVPLDTAVQLVADQAGLGVIVRDKVLFVTSTEIARRHQAEQERREERVARQQERLTRSLSGLGLGTGQPAPAPAPAPAVK